MASLNGRIPIFQYNRYHFYFILSAFLVAIVSISSSPSFHADMQASFRRRVSRKKSFKQWAPLFRMQLPVSSLLAFFIVFFNKTVFQNDKIPARVSLFLKKSRSIFYSFLPIKLDNPSVPIAYFPPVK